MKKLIVCLLCLVLVQLLFCSCSLQNTTNQSEPTQEVMSLVGSVGCSADGNLSVTYDSYLYDADVDTVIVTLENTSGEEEYIYSQKLVFQVFDKETGEYVSFGEDESYDDLALVLSSNAKREMQFKLSEKFSNINELSETDNCQLGITFENEDGEKETVFASIKVK